MTFQQLRIALVPKRRVPPPPGPSLRADNILPTVDITAIKADRTSA